MNIFAVRLKEALTAKNIKPSDLAKKTGIGKSSISDWLAGRYEAKQDKVYRIADALDINEAWLDKRFPWKKMPQLSTAFIKN